MLSVRLDAETEERLEALAKSTGRSKSYYVREAILAQLDEMEDRYVAIERLERPADRVPLDDLERELGLDR